jgi:hypothetical protein
MKSVVLLLCAVMASLATRNTLRSSFQLPLQEQLSSLPLSDAPKASEQSIKDPITSIRAMATALLKCQVLVL